MLTDLTTTRLRGVLHSCRSVLLLVFATVFAACSPSVNRYGGADAGPQIYAVPLSWSTAYLVVGAGGGVMLVDAGTDRPDDLEVLTAALEPLGGLDALRLIVLTHAHADHAGLADTLRALTGAPIMLGAADVDLYRGGGRVELNPIGLEAKMLKGAVPDAYALPSRTNDLVTVARDARPSLADYGLAGYVASVPGHTPGSIVVVLEDAVGSPVSALVGDLIRGGSMGGKLRPHRAKTHYFHEDRHGAEEAFANLVALGIDTFFLGHGGPIDAAEARRFVAGR